MILKIKNKFSYQQNANVFIQGICPLGIAQPSKKSIFEANSIMSIFPELISKELSIGLESTKAVLNLFEEGATIPFIARYRKEMTKGLDEVQIQNIFEASEKYLELQKRKTTILKSISEQGKLDELLEKQITDCWTSSGLEDLYLPYKQKRKTKADIAKNKGLEPLAGSLMKQNLNDPEEFAQKFLNNEVVTVEDAISGAQDIIAEWISERVYARNIVRQLFDRSALIESKLVKGKEEEGIKYKDYFKFSESLKRCPSHRLLAIRRGETEGILKVNIGIDKEMAFEKLQPIFIKSQNDCSSIIKDSIKDSYKRLIKPSIETEFKNSSKEKADLEAIKVFAENLRQLLLAPALGPIRTLAIDPGFRSGCKVVCLDENGGLLHNETIYPHPPQSESSKAASKIGNLIEAYKLDAIAIGNGTAGRETERFIQKFVRFKRDIKVFVVNEAGASIYSASKIAREEFPKYDITVRGSVSIGRRLMDPLAELVKIEPKSIGVGQYQHDVNQNQLKSKLDNVVISSVNQVGVQLNTASKHLLSYVSGLGPKIAENIIDYRAENGSFSSRTELKKVKGLGPKAFEQSAGFLRIKRAENPLDNSSIHPESYSVVEKMAKTLNTTIESLMGDKNSIEKLDPQNFTTEKFGLITVQDIIQEISKTGHDPRGKIKQFTFDPNIRSVEDLKIGMILNGVVSNITNFGAFIDLGVKQDGLVHISQLANRFVSDPNAVVQLQQAVKVKVIEVDLARKRIQLSMKDVE